MSNDVTHNNINRWLLNEDYDENTKAEIRHLQKENPQALIDAFYTTLSFGTGGLRGIMGVGTNRMNVYTVRAATQGLANYLMSQPNPSVFIGYDSRHNSRLFAEEAAKVLAGNGIKVFLFKDLRPSPLVSFGCRYKKCNAAIMITASHNPKEYNGYKVFWSDGAQVLPPHDKGIIAEVNKITDPTMVKTASSLKNTFIEEIDQEVDEAYLKATTSLQHYAKENQQYGNELHIVYTSLHGTGITLIPPALKTWGFKNIRLVDKQVIPDGHFSTVDYPNPEEPAALQFGIDLMLKTKSDLLIATDPDTDRMGAAIYHRGKAVLLNGNQIASICLEHICHALTSQKKMPANAAFIKSIVTTELFQAICDSYGQPCFNVLPGFKYFGELIRQWEQENNKYQYLFGGEESYGYLLGTLVRDKDAVTASALLCEAALQAKREGKTLVDRLHDLFKKYGVFTERLLSVNFPESKEGREKMVNGMRHLMESSLKEIDDIAVTMIDDYLSLTRTDLASGKTERIALPKSDVLVYWLVDGSKVMVRPSGTEPKVKLYCGVVKKDKAPIEEMIDACNEQGDKLLRFLKNKLIRIR